MILFIFHFLRLDFPLFYLFCILYVFPLFLLLFFFILGLSGGAIYTGKDHTQSLVHVQGQAKTNFLYDNENSTKNTIWMNYATILVKFSLDA